MGALTAVNVDVAQLPRARLPKGTSLERIFRRRDSDGRPRSPWFYSARGAGSGGRFDLAQPHGTCYLAGELDAAFQEAFRGAQVVADDDVARRHVLTATATEVSAPWADLAHEHATEAGVSLDTFSGSAYADTQALAAGCYARGDRGVISLIRHQSDGTARGYSMFGPAGSVEESPDGWDARTSALSDCLDRLSTHLRSRIHAIPKSMRPTSL